MPFPVKMEFRAYCVHVVDGDTFDVFVDMGCFEYPYKTIRLEGIDTPETFRPSSPEGKKLGDEATEFVKSLILDKHIKIITSHKTTFERIVGRVYYYDVVLDVWFNLADVLRDNGFEKKI